MLDSHKDRFCNECGREMTFVDHVCYGVCLGCEDEDERQRFIDILENRHTRENIEEETTAFENEDEDDLLEDDDELIEDRIEESSNVKVLEFD